MSCKYSIIIYNFVKIIGLAISLSIVTTSTRVTWIEGQTFSYQTRSLKKAKCDVFYYSLLVPVRPLVSTSWVSSRCPTAHTPADLQPLPLCQAPNPQVIGPPSGRHLPYPRGQHVHPVVAPFQSSICPIATFV